MREPLPTAEVDRESFSSDPVADAIRNVDLAAMWSAIAKLPRQQRDALLLREFGGLSYEELGGALAVSGSAVESLLFRARQRVRARLETASAGLAGGSWLDSLARLAGLGGGMAPVAAKVAAVGVGAVVATGGAVVGPRMLDHPRQPRHAAPLHRPTATAPQAPTRRPATVRLAAVRQGPVRHVPVRKVSLQPKPVDVARTPPALASATASALPNTTDGPGDSVDASPAASGGAHESESVAAAQSGSGDVGAAQRGRAETDSSSDVQSSVGHSTGGHALDGHSLDGHGLDGHGLDGHALDGHSLDGLDGHGLDGHGLDGHGLDGHPSDGHSSDGLDGHSVDGHSVDAHSPDAHSSEAHSSEGKPETVLPADQGKAAATSAIPALTVTDPTDDDSSHGHGSGSGHGPGLP